MTLNKFTEKAQEAVLDAQQRSETASHPQTEPEHLLAALLGQAEGIAPVIVRKLGLDPRDIAAAADAALAKLPRAHGGAAPGPSSRLRAVLGAAQAEAAQMKDEYVSTEHLLLAIAAESGRAESARLLQGRGHDARAHAGGAAVDPGLPAGDGPEPRGQVPGARALRPRPHGTRPRRQAGPGHRPRRRNPPCHPGPVAPHEEQPGAHRRARRRQDGHRRGTRPAHRARGRAGGAQAQAGRRPRHGRARRRREIPRRVRGAPEGGAQGSHGRRWPGGALHRRAPHRRRRGRRRGVHRRVQHAQADAGARRAPHHRRHDAGRVPQAHREGRRARAPVPARPGRSADGRGHHQHPPRAARALRDPPRRAAEGHRAGGGGGALAAVHRGPVPARQGHRPGGRGRLAPPHGNRLDAGGARRGRAPRDAARDRGAGAAQGIGRRLDRTPRAPRARAGGPEGDGQPAPQPLAAGEGRHPGRPRTEAGTRAPPPRHRRRRSARATTRPRRSCSTAACRRPSGASARRNSASPTSSTTRRC